MYGIRTHCGVRRSAAGRGRVQRDREPFRPWEAGRPGERLAFGVCGCMPVSGSRDAEVPYAWDGWPLQDAALRGVVPR